ncbi:MAG TPA: MFS transporter [Anaerolineales bacterium]|nr:MFS transporter [Anaerolineales bacterium]
MLANENIVTPDYPRIARNATLTMLGVQALGSLANSLMATVSTIVGADLSGSTALSGLPGALLQIGAALASLLLGLTMDRWGRRNSLAAGMWIGVFGAVVAGISVVSGSFPWFLVGLMLVGFTRAVSLMGRFVAAEVSPPVSRGRAISYVILGGTFGSVIGPFLVDPSGRLAVAAGLDEFVGPYAGSMIALVFGALLIYFTLRPEPRDIGRQVAERYPETGHAGPARSIGAILRTPTAFVAVTAMVFGQVVMIGLMGITSLHMHANEHPLSAVSIVFSAHTLGMFAFSIVTGQLLDRWGRGPVILAGAVMLILSAALAPIWLDVLPIAVALFLLGLGWNFTYIGGSTMLADMLSPAERARTQGANELVISLLTAVASFASGPIFTTGGYALVGLIAASLAVIPLALTGWWLLREAPRAAA